MSVSATPLLQRLSTPLTGQEVHEKKGQVAFRAVPFIHAESKAQVAKISKLFATQVIMEAQAKPAGIHAATVLTNLKSIKTNLLSRTSDAATKAQIKQNLKVAKFAVTQMNAPTQSKKKSGTEFFTRRITRYVLYKLAHGGSLSALTAGFSIPAMLGKDGFIATAAGTVFGSQGIIAKTSATVFGPDGIAPAAAKATGRGIGTAAGAAGSVFSSVFMQDLLAFLVITEGPGVVGHLARRLTPKPVKAVYNFFTPGIVQRGVNFVTHTDKPVAKGLDYVIDGLAVAFR